MGFIPFLTSRQVYKMNFSLTFVMLVLLALANAAPKPKTFLVETADESRTEGRDHLQMNPWLTLEQIMRKVEVAMIIGMIKCSRISILIMVESKKKCNILLLLLAHFQIYFTIVLRKHCILNIIMIPMIINILSKKKKRKKKKKVLCVDTT